MLLKALTSTYSIPAPSLQRAGALALLALVAACSGPPENGAVRVSEAGEVSGEIAAGPSTTSVESAASPTQVPRMPLFDPAAGPVGSDVELWMDGLPRSTDLYIGFGTLQGHTIVQGAESDEEGVLATRLTIPSTASVNRSHYFFVADESQLPMSVSRPFLVTGPDGRVEVRGEVQEAEGMCVTIRGLEDERYSLQGSVPALSPGDRVVVRGRVVLEGGCPDGLTLEVETVDVRR